VWPQQSPIRDTTRARGYCRRCPETSAEDVRARPAGGDGCAGGKSPLDFAPKELYLKRDPGTCVIRNRGWARRVSACHTATGNVPPAFDPVSVPADTGSPTIQPLKPKAGSVPALSRRRKQVSAAWLIPSLPLCAVPRRVGGRAAVRIQPMPTRGLLQADTLCCRVKGLRQRSDQVAHGGVHRAVFGGCWHDA
jgi:hypothetical protein